MGPPKFIGGNSPFKEHSPRDATVLQWGRRNSSAEIQMYVVVRAKPVLLQWGRRNSSAEIPQIGAFEVGAREASMGPPKFIGGNK